MWNKCAVLDEMHFINICVYRMTAVVQICNIPSCPSSASIIFLFLPLFRQQLIYFPVHNWLISSCMLCRIFCQITSNALSVFAFFHLALWFWSSLMFFHVIPLPQSLLIFFYLYNNKWYSFYRFYDTIP